MAKINEWNIAEKGAILGLLIGLVLLALSYIWGIYFDLKFCLEKLGYENICIRYVSLTPLVFAVFGLIIALMFGKQENI